MSLYESVKSGGYAAMANVITQFVVKLAAGKQKNKWHAGKSIIPSHS